MDNSVICVWDAGIVPHGCSREIVGLAARLDSEGAPTPGWFLRKNVKGKELRVEMAQECHSMGVMKAGGRSGDLLGSKMGKVGRELRYTRGSISDWLTTVK